MGNVIFSAALVMAGTFGSMTSFGVTSISEIGIGVVGGLFLYALVQLGFFVLAAIVGHTPPWLFNRRQGLTFTADPVELWLDLVVIVLSHRHCHLQRIPAGR